MRLKFVAHMIVLMSIFLAIALTIETTPLFRWVLWGLFSYVIAKDLIDEYKDENRPDQEGQERQKIMDKLNKIIQQLKNTV